jgi:hypothetical protein
MTVSETMCTLQDLAEDTDNTLSIVQLHDIYFSIEVLRSLPPNQVTLVDALLDLEKTIPRN